MCRYLEELSRRYKRQMEEMYSSLNHTITKLSNTAKIAAEQVSDCLVSQIRIHQRNWSTRHRVAYTIDRVQPSRACPTAHLFTFLSHFSGPVCSWITFDEWPGHFWLIDYINADPHELQVTWRSVYNDVVWLCKSYLWIERYLYCVVEGSHLYSIWVHLSWPIVC